MPFKSKDQIAKFGELVKEGKMTQAKFDEWMAETHDAHKLPQRVGPAKTKMQKVLDYRKKKYGL